MNLSRLKDLLEGTGFPVTYSHFIASEEFPVPDPPYICYLESFTSNMMADNTVYKKIRNVSIELYTNRKDLIAEDKLETILQENEIPFESTETFIESEELFQKIYEVRLF